MASIANDLALIKLVEDHRHLYDRLEPLYKNKTAVEKTWQEISKFLNIPADDCQRRWCVIRNRYAKEKRLQSDPNAMTPKTVWPCMDALGFLAAVVKPRRSFGMVSSTFLPEPRAIMSRKRRAIETVVLDYDEQGEEQWIKDEQQEYPEYIEMEESGCGSSISVSSSPSYVSVRKMSTEHQQKDAKEEAASSSKLIEIPEEHDADLNFCLSLHKSLKELNRRYNMKAKIEILQVIDKYQTID